MMQEARDLLEALQISQNSNNLDVALDVIQKYGGYRKAMVRAVEIKFKKKELLLFALLGEEHKEESFDEIEEKAKELILWCGYAEDQIYKNIQTSKRTYADEIKGTTFSGLSEGDLAILNQVEPYCSHKRLIGNIRMYTTEKTVLEAFKRAIRKTMVKNNLLENNGDKKLLLGKSGSMEIVVCK